MLGDEPMLIGKERANDIASFFSQRDEEQQQASKVHLSRKEKVQQERENKRRQLNEEISKARKEPVLKTPARAEEPQEEESGLFGRMGQYDPQDPDKISLFSRLSAPGEDEREQLPFAQSPSGIPPQTPEEEDHLKGLEFGDEEPFAAPEAAAPAPVKTEEPVPVQQPPSLRRCFRPMRPVTP